MTVSGTVSVTVPVAMLFRRCDTSKWETLPPFMRWMTLPLNCFNVSQVYCFFDCFSVSFQEVWHFYLGDPLTIYELDGTTGIMKTTVLGNDILSGQTPQHVVPAGVWFGSFPTKDFEIEKADDSSAVLGPSVAALRADTTESRRYTLVGCTVAPAFEFADFEMAQRAELLTKFPHAASFINTLTDP